MEKHTKDEITELEHCIQSVLNRPMERQHEWLMHERALACVPLQAEIVRLRNVVDHQCEEANTFETKFFWSEHVDAVVAAVQGEEYQGGMGSIPARYEDIDVLAEEIAERALSRRGLKEHLAKLAAQRLRALMRPVG